MPDNIKDLLHHALPFMVAANQGADKVNITRMLEAVIIAGLVAAGGYFMLIPELKTEFRHLTVDIQELGGEIKAIKTDVVQLQIDAAVEKARHPD